MTRWRPLLPGLAALLCLLALGPAAPVSAASLTPAQETLVREVASELRCVVCQNLSVADSPSDLAKEMRGLVREQVLQGKGQQQILDYFVSRYGEFVLLSPPKRGFNLLVWGLPFLGLAAGAAGVYALARRWTARRAEGPTGVDPAYAERVRRELAERRGGE